MEHSVSKYVLARQAIDVFDSSLADSDAAYLTTHTGDTWEQVERYCRECDGVTVF